MPEQRCVYQVIGVPTGCTTYTEGEIVPLTCESPCDDIIISDGPCAGTMLAALDSACMVYPPQ